MVRLLGIQQVHCVAGSSLLCTAHALEFHRPSAFCRKPAVTSASHQVATAMLCEAAAG